MFHFRIKLPAPSRTAKSAPPDEQLAEAVSRLVRGWMKGLKTQGRAVHLSMPQLMLLHTLTEVGEVPVSKWARMVGASPSATTALLDGMEHDGYVRRTHARDDRRQVLISLLPRGRQLADRMMATQLRAWRGYCADIPAARLRGAARTLEAISARMSNGGAHAAARRASRATTRNPP